MSGEAGATEAEEFATLLRELKDRSGLSYGALAKRVHMSTSTLHRYCSGGAVPGEYAPLDRLARVCRATPQEVVELHRRWVLADAARRPRVDPPAAAPDAAAAPEEAAAEPAEEPAAAGEAPAQGGSAEPAPPDEPVVVHVPPSPVRPRRRRTVLVTSAAVAAVLVAASLLARPLWKGEGNGSGGQQAAGAAATSATTGAQEPRGTPSPSGRSRTPSAPAPTTAPTTAPATKGAVPAKGGSGQGTPAVPLTVSTRPYVYDSPCDQRFLVDKAPGQVGPFPDEQDAPRWVSANGAVAAGGQQVALTVQGRPGADTVVLEALHVDVASKHAPLAWNDYTMSQCGGMVDTKSFDIDLDKGSPTLAVKNGQRDFPYKVSESDPEVFYVTVHTTGYDVRWTLGLDWSSGDRHGTVRIDDHGAPFRTSADTGRPQYGYPPGGGDWIPPTG
nr:helix-turn-helix domain-containing protein [Streptomyces sp. NBC_00899]